MLTGVNIEFTSDITAKLVSQAGDDLTIAQAAWVSTQPASNDTEKVPGLINYLIKHRHGSPFEQGWMRFEIHCPIFVAREFVRHRIGVSLNEMSGRYTELEPTFWIPRESRPLVNVGTSARPKMEEGGEIARGIVGTALVNTYAEAWSNYTWMLQEGIAKEVARVVLPVGIYTRIMATLNPRSLLHFLSLRTHNEEATFISYPQAEIEELATSMEYQFAEHWPLTHAAFIKNGRVSP
jgi:thymidylate synthase (FAD)